MTKLTGDTVQISIPIAVNDTIVLGQHLVHVQRGGRRAGTAPFAARACRTQAAARSIVESSNCRMVWDGGNARPIPAPAMCSW
jgi:hypothetical protein